MTIMKECESCRKYGPHTPTKDGKGRCCACGFPKRYGNKHDLVIGGKYMHIGKTV